MIEHHEQVALICWFDIAYKKLSGRLFAIPNGGKRHIGTARKLKMEGVRAGVPDAFLPIPAGGYHGLFIEMKATKGKVSAAQSEWIDFLNWQGYKVVVCYGFEEAKKAIEDYLKE